MLIWSRPYKRFQISFNIGIKPILITYTCMSLLCFVRTYFFMPKTIVPFFNKEEDIPENYNIGITDWKEEKKEDKKE